MVESSLFPLCSQCGSVLVPYIDNQILPPPTEYLFCRDGKLRFENLSCHKILFPFRVKGCPVCFSREILFSDTSFCFNINCPAYHIEEISCGKYGINYQLFYTGTTLVFYDEVQEWQIQEDFVTTFLKDKECNACGSNYLFLNDFLTRLLHRHKELGKIKCRK